MKVKICGITTLEDAQTAIEAGADMLGFNFYPQSPRYVTPETCAAITAALAQYAPRIVFVGVFVNALADEIRQIMAQCGLHRAQLAGDEPSEILAELGGMAFKAIRPQNVDEMIACLRRYLAVSQAPAYLVDSSVPGQYGGTGQVANWDLARSLCSRLPILLAGGLTPGNVRAAVEHVKPWGVDVASGVEAIPGVKNIQKMQTFIHAARNPVTYELARFEDLPAILEIQQLAYQSEAELYRDSRIPPLTQTLGDLQNEFARMTFVKATAGKRIVGSVRGELKGDTCHIAKLIVHPEFQNQGIGTRLMQAIENRFTGKRYELFTGDLSTRNLHLYQKLGYKEFCREPLSPLLILVYMEKGTKNE